MNDQYAFAIAFEQKDAEDKSKVNQPLLAWQQLMKQIAESLESEGFPTFNHPRWEEFGEGRIFWGTKTECDFLKTVLASLPVSLYEERNLEAGYYADTEGTYYVNREGDIFGITHQTHSASITEVEPLWKIPLNAYRVKGITLEMEAVFQQAINSTIDEPLAKHISKPVDILEQQLDTQSDNIEGLEALINSEDDANLFEAIAPAEEAQETETIDMLEQLDAELGQMDDLKTLDITSNGGVDLLDELVVTTETQDIDTAEMLEPQLDVELGQMDDVESLDLSPVENADLPEELIETTDAQEVETAQMLEPQLDATLGKIDDVESLDLSPEGDVNLLDELVETEPADAQEIDTADMLEPQPDQQSNPFDVVETELSAELDSDLLQAHELTTDEPTSDALEILDPQLNGTPSNPFDLGESKVSLPPTNLEETHTESSPQVDPPAMIDGPIDSALDSQSPQLEDIHIESTDEIEQDLPQSPSPQESLVSEEQSQLIATLEQQTQQLQLELEEAQRSINASIDPKIFQALQEEKNQQSSVIQDLEQQIAALTTEVQESKDDTSQTIDLHDYMSVKAEVNHLTQQIQELEVSKQSLETEVEKWTQAANSKIELEIYDELSQKSQEQGLQLTSFQQEIDELRQELSNLKESSNDKVDRGDYEDALKEIQHLRAKLSQSWFTRLMNFFQGR